MLQRLIALIGYRGFIILGFTPLLYLTGTSLWDAASQSSRSEVSAAEEWVAQAKAKADELATKANGDHPPVVWLERRLPLPFRDDSLTDPPNQTAATLECQTLLAKWDAFVDSRKLATNFINTFETLVEPSRLPTGFDDEWCERPQDKAAELKGLLKEVEQSLTSLAELKQELDPDGDAADQPTRDILRLVDSLATAHEAGKTRLERMHNNLTTLVAAERAFGDKDYDTCLEDLASWQGHVPEIVNELRQSADFQNRGTKWITVARTAWGGGPNHESWPPLVDQAIQLVQVDYPRVPARANAALYEQVKNIRMCLEAALAIDELGKPQSLATWIREAQTIAAEFSCQTNNKRQFRSLLIAWMRGSLTRKEVPKNALQVAYMTDRSLKEGVFLPHGTSAFRYWKTRDAFDRDTQKVLYETLSIRRLKDVPAPPPTIGAVSTYNNEMARLEGEETNEESWKRFRDKCHSLQDEVIAFREKGGTVDVSFEGEIQFAGEILKHWSELEPFLK